jgi:hypothetical protein
MPVFLLAQAELPLLVSVHRSVGWYLVALLGLIGLWGIGLAVAERNPGRPFWIASGVGFSAGILQTVLGLVGFVGDDRDPGDQHMFYGIVLMFAFGFVYIFRSQFAERPALSYGLFFLFAMGLGIRGIQTFGQSFGA